MINIENIKKRLNLFRAEPEVGDTGFLKVPIKVRSGVFKITPDNISSSELRGLWESLELPESLTGTHMLKQKEEVHMGDQVFLLSDIRGNSILFGDLLNVGPYGQLNLVNSGIFDPGFRVKISCPHKEK